MTLRHFTPSDELFLRFSFGLRELLMHAMPRHSGGFMVVVYRRRAFRRHASITLPASAPPIEAYFSSPIFYYASCRPMTRRTISRRLRWDTRTFLARRGRDTFQDISRSVAAAKRKAMRYLLRVSHFEVIRLAYWPILSLYEGAHIEDGREEHFALVSALLMSALPVSYRRALLPRHACRDVMPYRWRLSAAP